MNETELYPDVIRASIKRDGYSVQAVLGDARTPVIAYTLGLVETRNHAEFIILHSDDRSATAFLRDVAQLVRRGVMVRPHSVIEGVGSLPVKALPVPVRDGLALCPVFRWIYPNEVDSVQFYQLRLGQPSDRPYPDDAPIFPEKEEQDVGHYLQRCRLSNQA